MDKFENLVKNKAFLISLFYVGIATFSVCSVYPKDLFYGEWSQYGLILTFPVSVISFGYRYMDADLLYPVFIIQFIMFFLMFLILSSFIKSNKR